MADRVSSFPPCRSIVHRALDPGLDGRHRAGVLVAGLLLLAACGSTAGRTLVRIPPLAVGGDSTAEPAIFPSPADVIYRFAAALRTLPTRAAVYRADATTSQARVARLADALGVGGVVGEDSSGPASSSTTGTVAPTVVTIAGVHLALAWARPVDRSSLDAWLVPVYLFEPERGTGVVPFGAGVPVLALKDLDVAAPTSTSTLAGHVPAPVPSAGGSGASPAIP